MNTLYCSACSRALVQCLVIGDGNLFPSQGVEREREREMMSIVKTSTTIAKMIPTLENLEDIDK